MTAVSRALRIWRERRVRDERGLALMFVLGVMVLTMLMVTALVGLTLVTIRVTDAQTTNTREQLALDGAIEAATNQLRYLPGSVYSDPCGVEAPFEPVQGVSFDDGRGGEIDVTVECSEGELGSAGSTGDAVRLVGHGGYKGTGPFDWRSWTSQWTAAAGGVPDLAPEPNLVHLGRKPLRFDSGVTVRNGAAVLRDNPGDTPAVSVAGQYIQGSYGPFAAPGSTGGDACGLLAGVGGEAGWIFDLNAVPECNSASARNVDRSPTGAQAGFAFDGEFGGDLAPLGSGVDTWRCNAGAGPGAIELYPGRYTQQMVHKLNQLMNPRVKADGSPLRETATWQGPAQIPYGQCYRKTFWFQPGVYYFDADELQFNNQSSYFVMGEPKCWDPAVATSRLGVIDTASNASSPSVIDDEDCWDGEDFLSPHLNREATLCDPEQSGVTFILSPRTRINHTAGRLGMCPAHDDNGRPLPALYQQTSVDNAVEVTLPDAAQVSRSYWACNLPLDTNVFNWVNLGNGNRCAHERAYRLGVAAAPGNTIDSAELLLSGYQVGSWGQPGGEGGGPHSFVEGRQTRIDVRTPSNSLVCSTGWLDGMPTGISGAPMTASFDLKDPNGALSSGQRCADVLNNSSDLQAGSELVVRHRVIWFVRDLAEIPFVAAFLPNLKQDYVVSAAKMVLNSAPMRVEDDPGDMPEPVAADDKVVSPAPFGDTSASVSNPAAPVAGFDDIHHVLEADGNLATPQMPCDEIMCPVTASVTPSTPFVHDLGMRRLTLPVDPEFEANNIDPNVETLRLSIGMDPSGDLPDLSLTQFNDLEGLGGQIVDFIATLIDEGLAPLTSRVHWSWFLREMELRAELRRASGETICRATNGPVASVQTISIDLLRDGDCEGRVQSYSDLQNADLHLSLAMPCVRTPHAPGSCLPWGAHGTAVQVRPPSIDHVQVRVTTDSWAGERPHSTVTTNAVAGNVGTTGDPNWGATFNVTGRSWLPLHDLDLHWMGPTTNDRPLFSGDLVLNGLGSRTFGATAQTGVVCCDETAPDSRVVLFTASIGDEERLRVRVRFTDVRQVGDNPDDVVREVGHSVEFLDWKRCRNGDCSP